MRKKSRLKTELKAAREPDLSVPPGAPSWVTVELMRETFRTWQPFYEKALIPEELLAIIMSVGQLVDVLVELRARRRNSSPTNKKALRCAHRRASFERKWRIGELNP